MPRAGEIWLAEIPFTSGAASKIRPVLVLWEDAADVVVAAVTKSEPRSPTDCALQDWSAEGLVAASTVRLSRLDCVEQSLLRRRLGALSSADAEQVQAIWRHRLQLRF
ncbi:MAG: type II toxin-antitoxin system PemK/MazF family toxin [Verrucomicrobiales bacterium]|nr:type II toxin-antitoxin system PemK/MazF family toxin [Verrucomicrobiales bacterium]